MREIQPVSRADAFAAMSRIAQEMCIEVEYNEQLCMSNRALKDKIEKLEKEIEKIKKDSANSIDFYRNLAQEADKARIEWQEKYYEAFPDERPEYDIVEDF